MLLEFMIENFMSFKEMNTFSLIATNDNDKFDEQVIQIDEKLRVLKNAAIFGANASGKSNLLNAISFVKGFVINSSKESQLGDTISAMPFKFSTDTENEPSNFELTFLNEEIVYRYGFAVNEKEVVSEWLFARYSSRETQLFVRKNQDIVLGSKFKEGKKYIDSVRENALFLSVCAQFNGEISTRILKWFRRLNIISSLDNNYVSSSLKILENENERYEKERKVLLNLITNIDVGIEDLSLHESDDDNLFKLISNLPVKIAKEIMDNMKSDLDADEEGANPKFKIATQVVKTVHSKYDNQKNVIAKEFHNFSIESRGTRKVFELAGPIIDTMFNGGILFIDEIQNSLHTKLVISLIKFFIQSSINNRAQFVYTTHDTNVLSSDILRRDQLWFVEKNKFGESGLTCLVDFEEHVRKDASIDKDYLRGRYGAIPYISMERMHGDR